MTAAERAAHLERLLDQARGWIASGRRSVYFRTYGMQVRGEAGIPIRLLTVSKSGVRARFTDGHVEVLHPEDITL